jgi:hypothetical protein
MASVRVARSSVEYADTRAAQMLTNGLHMAKREGRSLRTIAKELDYKQATVLSHMAKGRVPVPLDRAAQIAGAVSIDPGQFLLAALEQRTDDASLLLQPNAASTTAGQQGFGAELALLAGGSVDNLDDEHRWVMREVVTDASPRRRWLSAAELTFVLRLRELRPAIGTEGLSPGEAQLILGVIGDRKG